MSTLCEKSDRLVLSERLDRRQVIWIRQFERSYRVLVLAVDAELGTAGRQHLEGWATRE